MDTSPLSSDQSRMLVELARKPESTLPVPVIVESDSLFRRVALQNTQRSVADLVEKGLLVDVTKDYYQITVPQFIDTGRLYRVYDLAPGVRYLLTHRPVVN